MSKSNNWDRKDSMEHSIAVQTNKGWGIALMENILNGWSTLMTDNENKEKEGFHVGVDGGINISKQAVWRTIVIIFGMATGGGVVATKIENASLHQQIVENRVEIETNKSATTRELTNFKSVIDDVVNFLIEEKAIQKTAAAKQRYQEQIEKIRAKMNKPIGMYIEPYAGSYGFAQGVRKN